MKMCRVQSVVPLAALLCALIAPSPLLAGGHGNGHTDGVVCKVKVEGNGFIIIPETQLRFFFDFKFTSDRGAVRGHFSAYDEETGVCLTGCKVTHLEAAENGVLIDLDVKVGKDVTTAIRIIAHDNAKTGECDWIEIVTDAGSISGYLGRGCECSAGGIKVKIECKEKCKGGADCKGHPECDEHPYCKGKVCKGHPKCRDYDDDDDGHGGKDDDDGHSGDRDDDDNGNGGKDGDDDDGNGKDGDDDDGKDRDDDDDGHGNGGDHGNGGKCKGHPECKPKCKGKGYCKGHPQCTEHPYCEVPNCRGHKNCKDSKCKGHSECRKNYNHKKGCKAKYNHRQPCTCPGKKY